jgi:hypothetical protein
VEVRGEGVLEKLDDEVARQKEHHHPLGLAPRELEAPGKHLQEDCGEHEAGPERDQKSERELVELLPGRYPETADDVGGCGEEPEK